MANHCLGSMARDDSGMVRESIQFGEDRSLEICLGPAIEVSSSHRIAKERVARNEQISSGEVETHGTFRVAWGMEDFPVEEPEGFGFSVFWRDEEGIRLTNARELAGGEFDAEHGKL